METHNVIDNSHPGVKRRKYRLRRKRYAQESAESPFLEDLQDSCTGDHSSDNDASDQLQEQVKDLQDRLVRSRADLENQRKRFQKEKDELRKYAIEDFLGEIINPMDHFAMAMQSLETATDVNSVKQGVEMIHMELMNLLSQNGLEVLNPLDQPFNPNFHEAIGTEFSAEKSEGQILKVTRLGWKLKERVIRPAMVLVNRKPVEV